MRIFASTGTKGGVGKSTFAILLAYKLSNEGKKVVLCDCDVECPNDYIIMNAKLKKEKNVYQRIPKLDKRKCKKCGICAKKCRSNAIFWIPGEYPKFIYDMCNGCGVCWHVCPFGAIKIGYKKTGYIYKSKINENLLLITGKSIEGVEETSIIVEQTKEYAKEIAKSIEADILILDTGAGIHCNVIRALTDADHVYIVTEPTPLGEHDLEVSLKLLEKLGKKPYIIVNKWESGNDKNIEKIANDFGTKIVGRIPYSEKIIKAYSARKLDKVMDLLEVKL